MADDDIKSERTNLLKTQMTIFFDAYKQHMELFLKVIGFYLATISVIAAYTFSKGISLPVKQFLVSLIIFGSIISLLGCAGAGIWLWKFEEEIKKISNELGISVFPFVGAKGLILFTLCISFGFTCIGLILFNREDLLLPY
jgi:hypothetical protein